MEELKYTPDQYHKEFDAKEYLGDFYNLIDRYYERYISTQYTIWSNLILNHDDGIRHLEFGGGPGVADLISAAPKVDYIVFSDFTKANRRAVSSWLAGEPEAHDWKPLIKYVVNDLEGKRTTEAVLKREEELKNKIKSVVACDIHKTPAVDLEDVDIGKPFDTISTSFCLQACVTSEEQYKSAVVKLCEFLKPNGYLLLNEDLGRTYYEVGERKYYTFPLTKDIVENAMKEAHVTDIKVEILKEMASGRSCIMAYGRKSIATK